MADYKNYLAANILSEDKMVTYRLLSRALKVHVNTAKEMLYEFHRQQNGKKPGTVHATYLISGTKRVEEPEITPSMKKDGEDEHMQSSPFMNSSMPQADEGSGASSVLTITLTREEDLEKTRSEYEQITSIHIYSLGPHPLKDLQLLSDSSRELQSLTASEDPLSSLPIYGTITNPAVKRRANRRPPPAPASIPAVQPKPKAVEAKEAPRVKAEPKSSQSSSAKDFFGKGKEKTKAAESGNGGSSKESTPNPPTFKKESSSLFKSFAKAKPKLERKDTDSSAVASSAEDEPMKDVSDDEEETYVPPSSEVVDSDRKSRKEREAALKKMMEDDDDDEDEVVPTPEEGPEEEEGVEVLEEVKEKEEPEPAVEVKDGRRRGRRRVMKKKTVKDDEGYLVTKEEAVWESFSEDEPAPPPKPKVQASSTTSKGKKPAAKVGQGNIMSFFGKK